MLVILNFDKNQLPDEISSYEITTYIRRALENYGAHLSELSNLNYGTDAEVIILDDVLKGTRHI